MKMEDRVKKLERENRCMRWAFLFLFLILLGSCAKEPELPSEIVARQFKVVDEFGNVHAVLGVAPWNAGEGLLTLHDQANDDRRTSLGPADLDMSHGVSSVHLEAGQVSMLLMRDEGGWTGAKLSAHRDSRESSLWLTEGKDSIFRGPQ